MKWTNEIVLKYAGPSLLCCEVKMSRELKYVIKLNSPNNMFRVCEQHTPSNNTFTGIQRKRGPVPGRKR
jgi:hypothetical protein